MDLLVLSTLSCGLDHVLPVLIEYVLRCFFAPRCSVEMKKMVAEWKDELSRISMVDEFAAYAKLQRKCSAAENILNKQRTEQLYRFMERKLVLTWVLRILNRLFILLILYMYTTKPVIILSEGLLWPIQKLLSFPCQDENAISLPVWLTIAQLGISVCKKLCTSSARKTNFV